jgi:hypothetical protein
VKPFNLIITFCSLTLLFSCINNKKEANKSIETLKKQQGQIGTSSASYGFVFDTAYFDNDEIAVDTIKYLTSSPKITALPFGYDFDKNDISGAYKYNSKLLYKHNYRQKQTAESITINHVYKLPLISKLEYISISSIDSNRCNNGEPFSNYIKLENYSYRLPDIYGYQCYFWGEELMGSKFPEQVKKRCEWCILSSSVGYLIFYDPKTHKAKTVAVSFSTFRESDHDRLFYIDKSYTIHLVELMYDEDDDPKGPIQSHIGSKYLIKLSRSGDIVITKTH